MAQETIEQTFTVGTPARLAVRNIRGAVDVQTGPDGVVAVTAVKHSDSGSAGQTRVEIHQEPDGRVVAEARFESWGLFFWQRPCRVDFSVRVPRACAVEVRCVSSSAALQGLGGEFDLRTVSGALSLRDLSGRLEASTVSGDIAGERLAGQARLNSTSGRMRLNESHLASVEISTVSGDIVVQTPLQEGPYRFRSVSGSVRLQVPPETACSVEAESISGRLRVSLPTTSSEQRARHWRSEVQGGGVQVHFHSVSGDFGVETAP